MFFIKYIKNLFLKNVLTLITLLILLLSIFWVTKIEKQKEEKLVVSVFKNYKWNYVIKTESSYNIMSFNSKQELCDNILIVEETPDILFVPITIIVIFSFLLLFIFIERPIRFEDILTSTKLEYVKCDSEDGIYYYHYKGKLLYKSKDIYLDTYNIESVLKNVPINLLPKYDGTRDQIRDRKLKSLLDSKGIFNR